jgi:hypothetical protein
MAALGHQELQIGGTRLIERFFNGYSDFVKRPIEPKP